MPTFGEHLVHEVIPEPYRPSGPLTKSSINQALVALAKKEPEKYADVVTRLKRLGDETATLEGVTVGLADVGPQKKERDALLAPFEAKFHTASESEKEKILLQAQNALLDYTKKHPSTMGEMIRSGGRGNAGQLMKIVAAPVLTRDEKEKIVPWMITRSYAEGLRPSDAWVAGNEARINSIRSTTSVVEPGDLSKILINNMSDKLITKPDCGTSNGLVMDAKDGHIIDRFLAKSHGDIPANTLITPQIAQRLSGSVLVRSPMTCQAHDGICQKCQGLNPSGKLHDLGVNVGMRAAQAMAEPLTQFALNAKHGGRILTEEDHEPKLEGIKGVRQVLEIPQSFLHKAALAEHDGTVTKVEKAPQGGHYIWLDDKTRHYATPELRVVTPIGTKVEAGDALTNGVPKPDDVVRHKGLGAGRQYLVEALHNIYKNSGADVDRRHIETLASSVLNNVRITDPGDDHDHGFIKGDIVNYNRFNAALAATQKRLPLADAVGETLADNTLHFTAGTRITPSVQTALSKQGITQVGVATVGPRAEPVMRPATRTPLMNPDWMARLAHRYLKESLVAGAHKGDVSDIHGYHPVPAYAFGGEFGQGPEGRY